MMYLLVCLSFCLSFFFKILLWAWIAQLLIAGLFLLRYALRKLRRAIVERLDRRTVYAQDYPWYKVLCYSTLDK
jgi:hypothetical protein